MGEEVVENDEVLPLSCRSVGALNTEYAAARVCHDEELDSIPLLVSSIVHSLLNVGVSRCLDVDVHAVTNCHNSTAITSKC